MKKIAVFHACICDRIQPGHLRQFDQGHYSTVIVLSVGTGNHRSSTYHVN